MRERFEAVLRRYGQRVTVLPSGREGWALIQPVLERRTAHSHTPLGAADQRRWTYIGSGEVPLAVGARLVWAGRQFQVREAAEVLWLDERPLYWWALLAREKEAAA